MSFTCLNVWPIPKPLRKVTCFGVVPEVAFKPWFLHEVWTKDSQDIIIQKQRILHLAL